MLENIVIRKKVKIDDIVIDYPKRYDSLEDFLESVQFNLDRIESIKNSILEKGFNPFGLDHINNKKELDHPYILRFQDGKYCGIAGRVGRTIALKSLRAEGRMSEVEVFTREPVRYPANFREMMDVSGLHYGGFQKISFADKETVINGRDDIERDYWYNFCINDYFWLDKSVLDVACNIGAWCFMALERGASEVRGFDVNSSAIHVANKIKSALSLPRISFTQSSFENYQWSKKYDVVFLNQCIYHFKLEEGEAFHRISDYADFLFMYTFMTHKPEGNPKLGTYIPNIEKLKKHLIEAGFRNIYIVGPLGVIEAIKNRGEYGGKMYVISFKNGIEPKKMKYFRFDVNLLKKKNFVVGVFSGQKPHFLQWWLGEDMNHVVMAN